MAAATAVARYASLAAVVCAGLLASAGVFAVHSAPGEDAAMLIRYVQNLAAGHGIVWNVGEAPVDGATDLLPLVMAGAVAAAGVGAESAVRVVALAAHVSTGLLIFWAARFRAAALSLVAIVLFGPGWIHADAGFVTPVFGFFAALLMLGALRRSPALVAVAASLLAVTRPEGVALALFTVVAAFCVERRHVHVRVLGPLSMAWMACLAGYVIWRRWYFGDWIPSPYYIKGDFGLHASGLVTSANYVTRFLWFAIVPAAIAWRRGGESRRAAITAGIPVVCFASLWMLLSNATNFAGRFQYAVLPMTAVALALAWSAWWPAGRAGRLVCVLLFGVAAAANVAQYRPVAMQDGRRGVGLALRRYAVRAPEVGRPETRTMAVTEAGLLPLYSEWRAVDTLGLNDPDIARHRIDAARLERERPDVLLVHRSFPLEPRPGSDAQRDRTTHAVLVMLDYARAHGYILARAWGHTPDDTHAYFVRPNAVDADAIIQAIRGTPYACLMFSKGEAGLYGSIRRLLNVLRGRPEPKPACRNWSGVQGPAFRLPDSGLPTPDFRTPAPTSPADPRPTRRRRRR